MPLREIHVKQDGNCLFRCLAIALNHSNGRDHMAIRSQICQYLHTHESDYSPFLFPPVEDDHAEQLDCSNFQAYVFQMEEEGEPGTDFEIRAAANLYRCVIRQYTHSTMP